MCSSSSDVTDPWLSSSSDWSPLEAASPSSADVGSSMTELREDSVPGRE